MEDAISTGGSSCAVVEMLRDAGAEVQAVLAIYSHEFAAARQNFEKIKIPLYVLTDLDVLLAAAQERGALSGAAAQAILEWRADPEDWSIRHT